MKRISVLRLQARQYIKPYIDIARLNKPTGAVLLFLPCSWSILMAKHADIYSTTCAIGLCAIGSLVMRSAGCTVNDLLDRKIDRQVARTKDRPLACGSLGKSQAVAFLASQLAFAAGILSQFNSWSTFCTAAAALPLVAMYPLAKRVMMMPQLVLGATFSWGIPFGYAAMYASGASIPFSAVSVLYAGGIAWVFLYDTIYAHQDIVDDLKVGVGSSAIALGDKTKPVLSAVGLFSGACFSVAGNIAGLGLWWQLGSFLSTLMVQHQVYTTVYTDAASCWRGFRGCAWAGSLVTLGALLEHF